MHNRTTAKALSVGILFLAAGWTQTSWSQTNPDEDLRISPNQSQVAAQSLLPSETIGVKPQIGMIVYDDINLNSAARAMYGLTAEMNFASRIDPSWSRYFLGPQIGFFFSHLGAPSSNFFGSNPDDNNGTGGANILFFPLNLKAGYNVSEKIRVSIHGGANLIYRSIASSMFLGDSSFLTGSVWRLFPNIGIDGEFAVDKNLAVIVRPDLTLTPGNDIFSATIGVNVFLG